MPILGPPCIFVTVSIYLQWGFLEVSRGDKKKLFTLGSCYCSEWTPLDHSSAYEGVSNYASQLSVLVTVALNCFNVFSLVSYELVR